ncbi:MAG TPA: 4-hydroxybenzoate octaprenyltransferase [Desulfuromonadaceae bacterium]
MLAAKDLPTMSVVNRVKIFLEMIKFEHTVFALPFAFTGAVLAAHGIPSLYRIFWIVMAMVGARTAAMGLNRLIDAEIDGENPRTRNRAIPAGLLGKGTVSLFVLLAALLMVYAAYRLNTLCLYLSPPILFFLVLYSYCKRFTALSHIVLGICISFAPLGAWIAIRGTIDPPALLLAAGVVFWLAGFDTLYALQDLEYDRARGLHSIPVRLGVSGSLWAARIFHLIMLVLLTALQAVLGLGVFYMVGVAITSVLIFYEHWLLRHGDLRKLDVAFFNMNSYISITVFVFTLIDVLVGSRNGG